MSEFVSCWSITDTKKSANERYFVVSPWATERFAREQDLWHTKIKGIFLGWYGGIEYTAFNCG